MRFYKNPQGKLGEINTSEIKLDKKKPRRCSENIDRLANAT